MSGTEKVVCVTGASGYIASWLVKLLLQRGYTVKATVRDPNDPKKIGHLLALDGAKERLHLFKASLAEEGSFDSAIDGCQGVFHLATPVTLMANDPQTEIIDPAVNGVLNILRSCARVPAIKRVIITSSIASLIYNRRPLTPDAVIDETWFSDADMCKELKLWYPLSKILAEEAACRFAEDHGIDLVTLNPGFVIGPLIQLTPTSSMNGFLKLVDGTFIFPGGIYRFVDVRDVAHAHILSFETPTASGRYCLVETVTHYSEAYKLLNKLYPSLHTPEKLKEEKPLSPINKVSQDKAKSLGVSFTPLEVSLRDSIEDMKEKGFLTV